MKRLAAILILVTSLFVLNSCKYANCAAMNLNNPHGIGRPGAVDRVTGRTAQVRNFKVSAAEYKENISRDRDKDGIACEKA